MAERTLIKNISIINEGKILIADILIDNGLIRKIGRLGEETADRMSQRSVATAKEASSTRSRANRLKIASE
jgi:dihydroorotase-like cyclic amidohydrolase